MKNEEPSAHDEQWRKMIRAARQVPPFTAEQEERLFASITAELECSNTVRGSISRRPRAFFWLVQAALWLLVFMAGYLAGQQRSRLASMQALDNKLTISQQSFIQADLMIDDDDASNKLRMIKHATMVKDATISSDDRGVGHNLSPHTL